MRVTSGDLLGYLKPSRCEIRVWLRARGEPEAPRSAYDTVLARVGARHRRARIESMSGVIDLGGLPENERWRKTAEVIAAGNRIIAGGMLHATADSGGRTIDVASTPDLIIPSADSHVIEDTTLMRDPSKGRDDAAGIALTAALHAWLYERTAGKPPAALMAYSGAGGSVPVGGDAGEALATLSRILDWRSASNEPYSPVGWSKCGRCGFSGRCLPRAKARRDVALILGVTQEMARALHEKRIETFDQLLSDFDEQQLAALDFPTGAGRQRIGRQRASRILRMARAMSEGREILVTAPAIPQAPDFVMFDLEGMPPLLDQPETIYLWGMQVFGEHPGSFIPAVAPFGADGDRTGWFAFLAECGRLFETHGDIPFVHWFHYERDNVQAYVERYGDPSGVAARVLANLLDLYEVVKDAVCLPLPSYSLKVVEKYVGFERRLAGEKGEWAMAQYLDACETDNRAKREEIMSEILEYNREDLEATWAVFEWARKLAP
jgi:predicted RecB family nuclease